MTSLKTSIKTITYLSDTGCLEIQGASLAILMAKLVTLAILMNRVIMLARVMLQCPLLLQVPTMR